MQARFSASMKRAVVSCRSRAAVSGSERSGPATIAWTLRQPGVTAAIVGARNAGQVEGIIGGGDWKLTPEEVAEIEA